MPGFKNLLDFTLKKKKALFLMALILVSITTLFPQSTVAADASTGSIWNFALSPIRWVIMLFLVFITAPAMLYTWIMKMLADLSYLLLIYVVNQMVRDPQGIWAITKASANGAGGAFLAAWSIMRDYANMAIVLGLIGIAAATILHIREEYRAKKLLVPLIVVALLVNFSVVFVGLMIDGSNLIMRGFLVGAENEGDLVIHLNRAYNNIADPLYTRAMNTVLTVEDHTSAIGAGLTYAATEVFFGALYALVAVTFFLMTLVFIERYIMLAILFIFSPLAFVLLVFPFSRGQFDQWWRHFLKWCFAGVVAAFFLRISVKVLAVMPAINWGTVQGNTVPRVMPRIIMQLLVVLGFVFAGYKLSKKSSMVANKVIDGVKSAGKFAMGAYLGTATWGANKLGMTRAKDAIVDKATRIGEKFGFVDQGTADGVQKKKVFEAKKRLEYAKDDPEALAKIASTPISRMTSAKVREEKAAAAMMLFEKGNGKLISAHEREGVAAHAAKMGVPKSILTKDEKELLTGAKEEGEKPRTLLQRVARGAAAGAAGGSVAGPLGTGIGAAAGGLVGAIRGRKPIESGGEKAAAASLKMKERQLLEAWGTSAEEAERLVGNYNPTPLEVKAEQQRLHEEIIKERALGYRSTTDQEIKDKIIDDEIEAQKATGTWQKDIVKRYPTASADEREVLLQQEMQKERESLNNEYGNQYKPSATTILKAKSAVRKEKIEKAVAKLGPAEAAKLPKEAISHEVIALLRDSQLEQIGKRGGPALVDEFKKYRKQSGKKLANQSEEYQKLEGYRKSLVKGSPERRRLNRVMDKINTADYFK